MTAKSKSAVKAPSGDNSLVKWYPLVFFLLAFFLYVNTVKFGYVLDDGIYTTENKYVQQGISSFYDLVSKGTLAGFDGSNAADYRPVVLVSFAMEKSLFGNSSTSSHLFNVLLYALLCALLFRLMHLLFISYPVYIPVCITALFTFHPIHTEVVANIKSRDELLCLLFGLLTLYCIVKYVKNKRGVFLISASIAFLLCILSKESGFAFLGLIPLVLWFFTEAPMKRIIKIFFLFAVLTGIVLLVRRAVLDSMFLNQELLIINNSLMAATHPWDRLATNFTMLLHALKLLFFPYVLSWDYSYNTFPVVNWYDTGAILSFLIYSGLFIIALRGFKSKNVISFAILFYFISYFITSNLVLKIGSSFAERFLFTPSLAFCIVLPFLLAGIFQSAGKNPHRNAKYWVQGVVAVVSLLFIIRTTSRANVWKDSLTLDASGVETSPNSARTHYAYADDYTKLFTKSNSAAEKKEFAGIALSEYQKSLDIYDKDGSVSDIYFNMGMLRYHTGDTTDAIQLIHKSLALNPRSVEILYNLGVICFERKEYSSATDYLMRALHGDPVNANILAYIGLCYQQVGNFSAAKKYYVETLKIQPSFSGLTRRLNEVNLELGDTAFINDFR